MDDAKKYSLTRLLLILFFIIFPFGQLLRYTLGSIHIQAIDIVVSLVCLTAFSHKLSIPKVFTYAISFLLVALFSLFLGLRTVGLWRSLTGLLYLVRLVSFSIFFLEIWNMIHKSKTKYFSQELILNLLLITAVFISVFGWVQYIYIPDLRSLAILGWDDHLYRLAGTFLDPGFTGILLALGALISYARYLNKSTKIHLWLFIFMTITILFTYSRASYISLIAGLAVLSIQAKRLKTYLFVLIVFLIGIYFLPRPSSEGVNLLRTYSISSRFTSFKDGLLIWQKMPLFGVGYNNICWAKKEILNENNSLYPSNACSGIDSSIIYVLATTGTVGLIIFLYGAYKLVMEVWKSDEKSASLILASLVAVFVNSFFINSLFYSWVLGWIALLLATLKFKENK